MANLQNSKDLKKEKTHIGLVKAENEEQRQIFDMMQDMVFGNYYITDIPDNINFIKGLVRQLKTKDDNLINDDSMQELFGFLDDMNLVVTSMYYLLRPFK